HRPGGHAPVHERPSPALRRPKRRRRRPSRRGGGEREPVLGPALDLRPRERVHRAAEPAPAPAVRRRSPRRARDREDPGPQGRPAKAGSHLGGGGDGLRAPVRGDRLPGYHQADHAPPLGPWRIPLPQVLNTPPEGPPRPTATIWP